MRRDDHEHGEIGPNGLTDTIVLAAEQGRRRSMSPSGIGLSASFRSRSTRGGGGCDLLPSPYHGW